MNDLPPSIDSVKEYRAVYGIELRQGRSPNERILSGYAAVFGSKSKDLGGFMEMVRRGAFAKSLESGPDVLALAHHDASRPLARRSAGTLKISEDARGLAVEFVCSMATTHGRSMIEDVRAGNVTGMSFGFRTVRDYMHRVSPPVRELVEVELFEVSPVVFPAYADTAIALRSLRAAGDGLAPVSTSSDVDDHFRKRLRSIRERLWGMGDRLLKL